MALNKKTMERLGDIGTLILFLLILAFFLTPILWLLSLSIRTAKEVYLTDLSFIPQEPTFENYVQVFQNGAFISWLINGIKLSVIGALGALVISAPAAYAFSRFHFRFKMAFMLVVLAFQMISVLVVMIPLYRYFDTLGLVESHFGASILYIVSVVPILTWMLKGFMDSIPSVLEEAAIVDGCSRWQAFVRIVIPLSMPGVASSFILVTILCWSQFIIPYILLSKISLMPIAVGILQFQGTTTGMTIQVLAAGSFISIFPAILVFLLMQRFIVKALMAGAVKG